MKAELEQLNIELEEYVGEYRVADESLFNLGVKLGRLLEQRKIEDYRLQYFVNQSNATQLVREKQKLIDELEKFLLNIICFACSKHIESYGPIVFDADWRSRSDTKLEEEIVEEFGVQIRSTDQTQVGGDFEVNFLTAGKLAELLEKFNIWKEVKATLLNRNGEESCTVYDEESVSKCFTEASVGIHAHDKSRALEDLKELHKEFCEYYAFFVLKYGN